LGKLGRGVDRRERGEEQALELDVLEVHLDVGVDVLEAAIVEVV
jgi:hypothetical protein